MMAAKVGTGIVAELGAMRISDEIDALEVMGIDSVTFLCATRLLAAWLVLPFMYLAAIGAGFLASYIAVVQQVGAVSSGGYLLIFWQFQNPPDFIYSVIKAMFMATAIVLVGCYYGYNASGGPVGRGHRDGEVDGAQPRARARDRNARHADLLGRQSASPDRRLELGPSLDLVTGSSVFPQFCRARYAVAPSSHDQAKRHRVWPNCSPLAKPRMVVGVTR